MISRVRCCVRDILMGVVSSCGEGEVGVLVVVREEILSAACKKILDKRCGQASPEVTGQQVRKEVKKERARQSLRRV